MYAQGGKAIGSVVVQHHSVDTKMELFWSHNELHKRNESVELGQKTGFNRVACMAYVTNSWQL